MSEEKVNGSAFDIGSFSNVDETEGEFLQLLNPANGELLEDKDGENIGIYLLGKDSKVYKDAQRKITNRRLNSKSSSTITAERMESEAIEVLAKCSVSWTGIVYDGEELECDFASAKKLYMNASWVKEQVDEFIAERANYLGK